MATKWQGWVMVVLLLLNTSMTQQLEQQVEQLRETVYRLESLMVKHLSVKEVPVSTVKAAAKALWGDGSKARCQKLVRLVDSGVLREGDEWFDESNGGTSRRQLAFYVQKCRERISTPKHLR